MFKDQGPNQNLGFGMPLQRGPDNVSQADSNVVQRALNGHPVMRFFAVAAASAVSMHVAGKVASKGGIKLAEVATKAAENGSTFAEKSVASYRKIQSLLDDLQGLERQYADPNDLSKFVGKDGRRDLTTVIDDYDQRASRIEAGENLDPWRVRDEIQQRLVNQARRLPYEAPGFYIAQKAVIDPVMGTGQEPKDKVNWHNPIDVIGDFAYQSTKNLAMNILPFDLGFGAAKVGYAKYATQALAQPAQHLGFVTMKTLLEQVGADVGDLTAKTMKYSQSSLGAFSSMIKEAQSSELGFSDWVKSQKNAAFTNEPSYQNSNFAQRLFKQAKNIAKNTEGTGRSTIDALPGPFKGMGSGIANFKKSFKELNQTQDDWQDVIQGKLSLSKLAKDSQQRHSNLLDYMAKGGGTTIEQYGSSSFQLGKGGPIHPSGSPNKDFRTGTFYNVQRQDIYKGILTDELQKTTGLKPEAALQFTIMADSISPFPGAKAPYPGGENLMERMRFTAEKFHGKTTDEWWASVTRGAAKHGIAGNEKFTFNAFQQAVRTSDNRFSSPAFQAYMDGTIARRWQETHNLISRSAGGTIGEIKKPFERYAGDRLEQSADFLVRKTAQKLGISVVDSTGNPHTLASIKQQIWNRGLNPDNLGHLRGFLVSQKEIASPLALGGKNLFGFRQMSVQEGLNNQFYAGSTAGAQSEIQNFVNEKTFGRAAGRGAQLHPSMQTNAWDMKINKTYVGPNGTVLDFGRIARNLKEGIYNASTNYHIPLIKLPLGQLAGSSAFRSMENAGPVIMASGESIQPIAMGAQRGAKNPDFYLWLKHGGRGAKGKVVGITGDVFSDAMNVHEYKGLYRPFSTNASGMLGKLGAILTGQSHNPGSQKQEQRWKRLFDVGFDQENNLAFGKDSAAARLYRGIRNKTSDVDRNPFRAAQKFGSAAFNPASLTEDQSAGLENLRKLLRGYGFSNKTMQELAADPAFKGLFGDVDRLGNTAFTVPENLLPRFIRDVLNKDSSALKGSAEELKIRKLQQGLTNLLDQGEQQVNFWNLPAPQTMRATGISTRIDELKGELYDYMAIRTSVLPGSTNGGFDNTVQLLIDKLESLYSKGAISAAEKAEGRAAVLSLQVENARNLTHQPGADNFLIKHNQATLQKLFDEGIDSKALMSEVGNQDATRVGSKGFIRQKIANTFQSVPYESPYALNPFGAKHTFVPTFGSAFANNPRKATMGLLGLDWRDPDAISGASMPSAHLVNRLNKYFETFNVGLDPLQYKSPMDMYARGIVGKRVLPIYAAGAAALAIDRTAGGLVHKDANGDPIYSPLILGTAAGGVVQGQAAIAGLIPGGQTYSEKKAELESGEVPVRAGRFWLMGNTPFKGGRIQYFRPSWYQRLKAGATYTPEMHETPIEKLAFGYDFSPLRPLDPYRREREDYSSRPYPVTGDYFTGPWGPLTTVLNSTVGKILKPRRRMHGEEMKYGLSQYAPVGDAGAYFSQTPVNVSQGRVSGDLSNTNAGYMAAAGGGSSPSGGQLANATGYAPARGFASASVRQQATGMAMAYSSRAGTPATVPYGVPYQGGMQSRVISSAPPIDYSSMNVASRRFAYQTQEIAGIYGFASASAREGLGLGSKDLAPTKSVLEPSSRGYSASRSFWNLQMGGIGDLPLPFDGKFSNLELSEIVRRFVPKEPSGITYINNIPNEMGKRFPWLPGSNYPIANVKSGDPYTSVPDAEVRLPGTGYSRTHTNYGQLANAHDILGDVAPWSDEYKSLDRMIDGAKLDPMAQGKIAQTRAQVEAMRYENEFTPYQHRYDSITESATDPTSALGKGWEWLTHRDTYLNTKLGAPRTVVEDWERDNVYGSTFPKWETPYSSFIRPAIDKATQRDPFLAALSGGSLGYLFGATAQAKSIGSVVGGAIGLAASIYGKIYEKSTGERFIPLERRKELALEEQVDILDYTRSTFLSTQARMQGDQQTADFYTQQSKNTMYGADLNSTPEQLSMAIPKRKREHFRAMLYAPPEEREQILSTAGRLERRILEAAWGQDVEARPDLKEYYQDHELPPPTSDVWRPEVSMDTIKIKMGQQMGLDLAQMGYYPQQIQEANLINPSYPSPGQTDAGFSMRAKIKRWLTNNNINGQVSSQPVPYASDRVQLQAGVY